MNNKVKVVASVKKIKLLFATFFILNSSFAQRNAVWCFGDSAGIDFTTSPPSTFISDMKSRGSCAAICDSSGALLFYTGYNADWLFGGGSIDYNGEIYNKLHQRMDNGDGILTEAWYFEQVIVPDPGNVNQYYIFSISVTGNLGVKYHKVDMSYNNGLGKVVMKNVSLLNNHSICDGIAAIKHGNGRDWWVIFRPTNGLSNTYYKYLVAPTGIGNGSVQNIGTLTSNNSLCLKSNQFGDHLAVIDYLINLHSSSLLSPNHY